MALMVVAMVATFRFGHPSMGPLWFVGYAIPVLCLAFVAWAVLSRGLPNRRRRAVMVVTILFASGVWTLVRTEGIDGNHISDFAWRWVETSEQRLMAQAGDEPTAQPLVLAASSAGVSWTGFRGPARDGVIPAVRIETDWSTSPPEELWRRPVGPGWSSFAARGDLFYTQEQRGDDEVVACYQLSTGELVWKHHDSARFYESNAGAGPRATPTLSGNHLFTYGATGILNALDALSGSVVWSRNAATDTEASTPDWGFSSSPLVIDDLVIVDAGGLAAYDLATGEPRWFGPTDNISYSSPQLLTLDGVAQVVLMSEAGATSVTPADGTLLWEYPWPGF